MIAACFNTHDEAHIIEQTVRHLLESQGVDHCWVMDWYSTDGTPDLLHEIDGVTVVPPYGPQFYWDQQGTYTSIMADVHAGPAGAEWIICSDADEFWTGTDGRTVAEAIEEDVPPEGNRLRAAIYQYNDFDHRSTHPYPWVKVCYRWEHGLVVCAGNHGVANGRSNFVDDVLLVHELKFQGYEHFKFKMDMKSQVPWSTQTWIRDDGYGRVEKEFPTGGNIKPADGELEIPESERQEYWEWLWSDVEDVALPSQFRPPEWKRP